MAGLINNLARIIALTALFPLVFGSALPHSPAEELPINRCGESWKQYDHSLLRPAGLMSPVSRQKRRRGLAVHAVLQRTQLHLHR
jgi:hypothetical protein